MPSAFEFEVTSADVYDVGKRRDRPHRQTSRQWDLLQSGGGHRWWHRRHARHQLPLVVRPAAVRPQRLQLPLRVAAPRNRRRCDVCGGHDGLRRTSSSTTKTRVQIITDLQRWIMDEAWSIFILPMAATAFLGVSARLRDYGKDDWFNSYSWNECSSTSSELPGLTTPRLGSVRFTPQRSVGSGDTSPGPAL